MSNFNRTGLRLRIGPQTCSELVRVKMAEESRRVVMVRVDSGKTSVTGLESSLVEGYDGIHFRRRTERLFGTFSGIVIFDRKEYEMVPGSHVSYEVAGRVVTEAKYILKSKNKK